MNKRFYSLFEKIDGKWHRLGLSAYTKENAIRVYQNQLINISMSGRHPELRVVKD